jgi:hypothetical protein
VPDAMSAADLATLSLLDPDQGACPNGHPCRLEDRVGYRSCGTCDYRGLALICWEIDRDDIEVAAQQGADTSIVDWAVAFIADRNDEN